MLALLLDFISLLQRFWTISSRAAEINN